MTNNFLFYYHTDTDRDTDTDTDTDTDSKIKMFWKKRKGLPYPPPLRNLKPRF